MYPVIIGSEEAGKQVRCYCNLPSCVTTGYMCKSPLGGCFSHIHQDAQKARHGCIGSGDDGKDYKLKCMNSPSGSAVWAVPGNSPASAAAGGSLMLCCYTDLCNHVDSPQTRLKINETALNNWNANFGNAGFGTAGTSETNPSDVWFKAATIAVPICGALILFLLIALAVKILRTDPLDVSNKLSPTHLPHGAGHVHMAQPLMKKTSLTRDSPIGLPAASAVPLLGHSNFSHACETGSVKNDVNSLMNTANCDKDESYVIMQHYPVSQQSSLHKPSNAVRDVNINMEGQSEDSAECANSKLYEKQFLPSNDRLYNKETILHWGGCSAPR